MDIGRLKNNTKFYDGYEGEGECVLALTDSSELCVHIWDGYIEDIFGNPQPSDGQWSGITRDYQLGLGAFGEEGYEIISDLKDYICDLEHYFSIAFTNEETSDCIQLILSFFRYAESISGTIIIKSY